MGVRLPVLDEGARAQLSRLHGAVDAMVAPLVALHGARLRCTRGCHGCCVDGLTVFALEAARIVEHHGELLATSEPHPVGGCAFLDAQGACRIYAHRPYVCRTQGLPLRWLQARDGEHVELRDICELNVGDERDEGEGRDEGNERDERGDARVTPLTQLPAEHCFTLGPVEQRLREQAEQAGAADRIALRSLFERAPS